MKKISTIKERIKEFAENTGENKDLFFEKIGQTSSNFRGKKLSTGVNADVIEKIVTNYPYIDLQWLITGKETKSSKQEEKTIAHVKEPQENYGENYKEKYLQVLEKNSLLNEKIEGLRFEIKEFQEKKLSEIEIDIYKELSALKKKTN